MEIKQLQQDSDLCGFNLQYGRCPAPKSNYEKAPDMLECAGDEVTA